MIVKGSFELTMHPEPPYDTDASVLMSKSPVLVLLKTALLTESRRPVPVWLTVPLFAIV